MSPSRVLLVANQTATDPPLVEAVRRRAAESAASFHLVVPATAHGLHRVVDPEVAGVEAAHERLHKAIPVLSEAAGQTVTGHVGDASPLTAIEDALNLRGFDEVFLSTLPHKLSRWMHLDLPSKVAAMGVRVVHVTSHGEAEESHPGDHGSHGPSDETPPLSGVA